MTKTGVSSATLTPWPNPAWKENPYQRLLYAALRSHGISIRRTPWIFSMLPFLPRSDWLHLNWPETLYLHPDPERMKQRFERFVRVIRRVKDRGTRVIWTVHNEIPHDDVHREFHAKANVLIGQLSDVVHVHFPGAVDLFAGEYGVDREKLIVIPHGLFGHAHGAPIDRGQARECLGIPRGARVLLTAGYIRRYKGIETAVESFNACSDPDLYYVIAGSPEDRHTAELLETAARGNPRLKPVLGKVAPGGFGPFFSAADAFLFPSLEFFSSGSVVLALSYNLPVIAAPLNHTATFAGRSFFKPWDPPVPESLTAIMSELGDWLAGVNDEELSETRRELDMHRIASLLSQELRGRIG